MEKKLEILLKDLAAAPKASQVWRKFRAENPKLNDFGNIEFVDLNLQECSFEGLDLQGCRFTGVELTSCNFSKSVLNRTVFTKCHLTSTNFQNSFAAHTSFVNCNLEIANFTRSHLANASFFECNLHRAVFRYTVLDEAEFEDVDFNPDTKLGSIKSVSNCTIDRDSFDLLGVDFGGLTRGQIKQIKLTDDAAQLRSGHDIRDSGSTFT